MLVTKAIIIQEPHISRILKVEKIWEMRKRPWKFRGAIGLIRKGSGEVVGIANLDDCLAPLVTPKAYAAAERFHRIPPGEQADAISRGWVRPWVLSSARLLAHAVTYNHRPGSVVQIKLDPYVSARICAQLA